VYIGQTFDFSQRRNQHLLEGRKKSPERPLYRSMQKHGVDNFIFDIIEECNDKVANEREIHWIAYYDSTNIEKGYNLAKGGQGHSDESRRKLSEALKGNKHCAGRTLSSESIEKLRQSAVVANARRNEKRTRIHETRTCICGKTFTISFYAEMEYKARKTCSERCSKVRVHTDESRLKVSETLSARPSLRDRIRDEVISHLEKGEVGKKIAADLNVAYKTIQRIRTTIRSKET
jgi:group I intron endonuclease